MTPLIDTLYDRYINSHSEAHCGQKNFNTCFQLFNVFIAITIAALFIAQPFIQTPPSRQKPHYQSDAWEFQSIAYKKIHQYYEKHSIKINPKKI
ncbi:hypothetical protein [Cellvibrio sp. PSBB023]|uniref:hypothetical protein n=1 Tax=Cellvibrio sp. PSBB023 TaxID=1945512 RepID=UPI00098FF08F|nr:hypothetical protein [Cellvibrio sp. PSBB023]AQT59055.1 hypothetical protein B0D95_02370 [Cellvibrio sp. PSBB023]